MTLIISVVITQAAVDDVRARCRRMRKPAVTRRASWQPSTGRPLAAPPAPSPPGPQHALVVTEGPSKRRLLENRLRLRILKTLH